MVNKMVNRRRQTLTDRQAEVLAALREFILEHGYSPSIRQLGQKLNILSPSAVFKHLLALEKKGYLRRKKGELEVLGLPSPPSTVSVPLAGLVPAGHPREAFDLTGEGLDIPEWMVGRKRGNIFCVRVEGKSMVDAYIDDGDLVLVERTQTAHSGEMVIARLEDGSVTLKRLRLERGRVYLVPENPEFSPLEVKNLQILGRVIGVLRKY